MPLAAPRTTLITNYLRPKTMKYTLDSLKAAYKFWDAYRTLKAQHPGWKLRHPSWAGILDAFNNPPIDPLSQALARIAELEAQLALKTLTPELQGCQRYWDALNATNDALATIDLTVAAMDGTYGTIAENLSRKSAELYQFSLQSQMVPALERQSQRLTKMSDDLGIRQGKRNQLSVI